MKTANIKNVNGVEKKEVSKTRQFMGQPLVGGVYGDDSRNRNG